MPVPVNVVEKASEAAPVVKEEANKVSPASLAPPSGASEGAAAATDPCVVAGYEDCLRETIRFLVQDEKLPEEHPLVAGLNFHLASESAHKELMRVSGELAKKLSDELRSTLDEDDEDDSGMESSFSDEEEPLPLAQAYKITLEDDDNTDEKVVDEDYCMEEDMSDDEGAEDLITAKDILSHPYLRNELIKLVFQGCDLVATSTLPSF